MRKNVDISVKRLRKENVPIPPMYNFYFQYKFVIKSMILILLIIFLNVT